ncbi:JAB domain-containing protein [Pinibacter aurantiacus]|uniref:JAB domain-containing protein n=1 Tax=Pinibacter aurantiacus TaxID=2851599 RepID=A0A9E2S9T9_9BACT|nr:JAB domain-containing protein [Pinibacter aurantiacus]MBV4359108.1 JAB domain-containing protein [Pinibacter aurantiacus]
MEKSANTTAWMKVSELEIVYKSKMRPSERPQIKGSHDAYKLFLDTWNLDKIELLEQFKVMALNHANRVLGICELSSGAISATIVDPKLVFGLLLKAGASGAIICHCHPSGNLKPSNSDVEMTHKICGGGKLLDIKILDHLIITMDNYYSFADSGAL